MSVCKRDTGNIQRAMRVKQFCLLSCGARLTTKQNYKSQYIGFNECTAQCTHACMFVYVHLQIDSYHCNVAFIYDLLHFDFIAGNA